jgi:hypothetical protein
MHYFSVNILYKERNNTGLMLSPCDTPKMFWRKSSFNKIKMKVFTYTPHNLTKNKRRKKVKKKNESNNFKQVKIEKLSTISKKSTVNSKTQRAV